LEGLDNMTICPTFDGFKFTGRINEADLGPVDDEIEGNDETVPFDDFG